MDFKKSTTPELSEGVKSADKNGDPASGHLREFTLINLDLIQQQTDFLTAKDKTINELRVENETLKRRMVRMERRLLLKSDEKKSGRKRRRKGTSRSAERVKERRKIKSESEEKAEKVETKLLNVTQSMKDKSEESVAPLMKRFKKFTLTSSAYYTSIGENVTSSDLATLPDPEATWVATPKWTIKTYTSDKCGDNIENLSDEVFQKRHFPLEHQEKQRKRWDEQMIRQVRNCEKLKQRERKKTQKEPSNNRIQSFWPDPDEINDDLSLIVLEKVPVAVFGIPIPFSKECEPVLPWLNGKVEITTNNKTRRRKR